MEVDDDFQPQTSSPINGSIDVDVCARDKWRVEGVVCPVTNWDAYHVEPRLLDLVEVFPSNESVPMLPKDTESCVFAEFLSKCVLIDNVLLWTVLVHGIKD
jgi:hypothetical protein